MLLHLFLIDCLIVKIPCLLHLYLSTSPRLLFKVFFFRVKHISVSRAKIIQKFFPHFLLLIDVLDTNWGLLHEMFNKCVTIILACPSQLSQNLICEIIYSFLGLMQLLSLFCQHEWEGQTLILFQIVLSTDQLHHVTIKLPVLDIFLKKAIFLLVESLLLNKVLLVLLFTELANFQHWLMLLLVVLDGLSTIHLCQLALIL